jgi:PTH1 family peptidyl-tRNA hydrolase
MNLSGEAVSRLLHFFRIPSEHLIIVHDDLDLPPGKIRIRRQGSHGGHQGVKSVIEALGKNSFTRLKIGIGRPDDPRQDPADFVLAPLSREERDFFKEAVQRGVEAVEVLLSEGPEEAMNRFHKEGS